MLHTTHNYLFVQHHFHRIKPLAHMNSRLRKTKTKITSPYYLNYNFIKKNHLLRGNFQKFRSHKEQFPVFVILCENTLPDTCLC